MRNLSLGRRHLVNAYEVEAGIGVTAGNTVWSMPECLECEVLQKARYINTLTFTFIFDVWCTNTGMVWLPDGEKILKICMIIPSNRIHERDRRADGQTDTAWRHRPRLCTAVRGIKCVELSVELAWLWSRRCAPGNKRAAVDPQSFHLQPLHPRISCSRQ